MIEANSGACDALSLDEGSLVVTRVHFIDQSSVKVSRKDMLDV